MTSVIIRIGLRYIAALLVAKGVLGPDNGDIFSDPDLVAGIETMAGLVMAGVAEGWYYLAHRFGWAK